MKRTVMGMSFALMLGLAVAVTAQDQSGYGQSSSRSDQSSSKTVTYTGCLQEGSTPGTYVLANVTSSGSMSGMGGEEKSGTSGSSGSSMANNAFVLIPSGKVDLREHVGHEVQVTGMIERTSSEKKESENPSSGSSGSQTGSESGQSQSGMSGQSGSQTQGTSGRVYSGDQSNLQHIKVKSLKHISESCGQ